MYFLHSLPLVILTEVSGLIGRYCGHFWVIRELYILRQGRIFECEIFSVLSIAHAWTSVILAGNMIKNFFFFCGWNSTWTRTHICMTLPLLKAYFSWPLPFLQSQKVVTLPLFPAPSPPSNFWQVPNNTVSSRYREILELATVCISNTAIVHNNGERNVKRLTFLQ